MLLVVIFSEMRPRLRRPLLLCTFHSSIRPPRFTSNSRFRIYNEYMFASGWKIVYYFLRDILRNGVTDSTIRTRLTSDGWLRTRYLVLYDIVDTLTALYHTRLSLLATTSREFQYLPTIARCTDLLLALTLHFRQLILQGTSRAIPIMRKEGRNLFSIGLSSKHCKSRSSTRS